MANAFPSPSHEALDKAVGECALEDDQVLVKARYRQTVMHIRAQGGRTITVKPGVGGTTGRCKYAGGFHFDVQ